MSLDASFFLRNAAGQPPRQDAGQHVFYVFALFCFVFLMLSDFEIWDFIASLCTCQVRWAPPVGFFIAPSEGQLKIA